MALVATDTDRQLFKRGRTSLRLMLLMCTVLLASAQTACTARAPLSVDVAKLRLAAQSLGLNGSGLATVDMNDRQLTIAFDLPELTLAPDEPSLPNETCGRSWSCGCLRYEVCPGMELTTAMMRDFATVTDKNASPLRLTVSP